jgi:hypothetical protein
LNLGFEGGLRLSPHLALGLYGDVGVGNPAREIRDQCSNPDPGFVPIDCDATTGRFGVLLRHTFDPFARTTPWLSVGTGFEVGTISTHDTPSGGSEELFSYSGWEMLRLQGGVDFRSSQVFGVGFFGGVSFGRYSQYEEPGFPDDHLDDRSIHTRVEGGVRFTLFP